MAQDTNWENGSFSAPVAADTPDWESGEFAAPPKRSLAAAANDTVIEFANAAAGGASAAANFVKPGNAASRWIDKNIVQAGEDKQSDAVKAEKARLSSDLAGAGGMGDEAAAVGRYIVNNPLLSAAQAAGSFVGPGFAVKGAGLAARAAGAGAQTATRAGRAGGVAAGVALAGGDAAGTAYDLASKAGATEDQAVSAGRQASVIPAIVGGVTGAFGAEKLLAGAKGFTGGTAARALKTGASEALQEGVEEGVTQYEGQRAAVPYDPSIDPMKGVAGAATMGAALGGITGAGVGALDGVQHGAQQRSDAQAAQAAEDPAQAPAGAAPVDAAPPAMEPATAQPDTPPGAQGQSEPVVQDAAAPTNDPLTQEQRIAAAEEKLSFVQQQAQANGWDKRLIGARDAAQAELDALRPASEASAATPAVDQRPLSEQMGIDPAAGPLSKIAATAVDTGATPVQFLGATGRSLQPRQTGPGVTNESNVIDVQGRVVEGRAIGTPRRLIDATQPGASQQPAGRQALPAPANLREALDRIRAQRQEAANAQAAAQQAPAPAGALSAARSGAVEAAGPAPVFTTGVSNGTSPAQAQQGIAQPTQAGGAARPAATAAPRTAPAGGSGLQAGGLTNAAPAQNDGAQGQAAPGAQAQAPTAQGPVARPDGWRKSMLRAGPVAKAMGIETRGKRLAQVVAEIDARDTQAPPVPTPKPEPGLVRIGRDQTPLSEGGKPFKTRKAAGDAKKQQPMMRVVTVPGGFALADKTPAQLAAEARAARRLAQPRTGTAGAPLAAHEFIAAEGGLSSVAAADLGVDGNPRIGNRRLFAGRGRGMSMERAAEKLIAEGYLGEGATLNDAYDLIKLSLSRPQYNADGYERIAEAEAGAQYEDYLAAQEDALDEGDPWAGTPAEALDDFSDDMLESSGYDAATDAIKTEVRALLEMAKALGIDTDSITEEVHEQTRNATDREYYETAKSALEAAIARSRGDSGALAGGQGQRAGAAEGVQELDQPEALELASQTQAEAAAQKEAEDQAAKADAARQRAADAQAAKDEDRKRIAQASVRAADSFELGQDPLDSLTGQGGLMFSRAAATEVRNLVTLHNLTDENLRYADSMGGIPVPSIGITKVESPFGGFGNITLIAPKGMIDPKAGVPVYDRDAWTARFPTMNFKKVKAKMADAFYERMKPVRELMAGDDDGFISQLWEQLRNATVQSPEKITGIFTRYEAGRVMYAKEVLGKTIKVPMRNVRPSMPSGHDAQLVAYWKKHGAAFKRIERDASGSEISNAPENKAFEEEVRASIRRYAEAVGEPEKSDQYINTAMPDGTLGAGMRDRWIRDIETAGKKEVDRIKLGEAVSKAVKRDDPAYLRWVENLVKPLFDEPTITLRGREVAPTLDNIVDAMTVGATAGAEKSMTFSPGKVAAMLGKQFKSLDEIKAARDQVVSAKAETEGKKATDALLTEYRTHVSQFYGGKDWRGNIDTWAANDDSMEALAKAGKLPPSDASIRATLARMNFKGVDQQAVDMAREAIAALRNAATDYFEAKPQRAVTLDEFKGAVVPKGTSAETLAILEKHGIAVEVHNKTEGAREKAIQKLAKRLDSQSGDVLFARDSATPPADSNARNVATQMLVDGLKAKWTRAPEIIVARNMQDPQISQRVRDYDAQLKSQGSDGEARGFIYKGKVYLLSDQLKGPQQIAEVLFHEVLGHYGLRGAFGDALTPILNQVGLGRRKEVLAKAREYGMVKKGMSDADTWAAMSRQDRLSAAEEVLAEMAQSQPTIGFVQRAIAAIRNWLRANVPGFDKLALTDADIIQAYLLPARGFVTRSKETGAQSLERAMLAFSRGDAKDQTQTEAFKRWFGDSKVVDGDGQPLQVYHGTPDASFTQFKEGAHFTADPNYAAIYTHPSASSINSSEKRSEAPATMPVYLAIRKPFDTRVSAIRTVFEKEFFGQWGNGTPLSERGLPDWTDARDLLEWIEETGQPFDGILVDEGGTPDGGHRGFSWVPTKPTQIKSATGNSGAFDPDNADIRFSRSVAADDYSPAQQVAAERAFGAITKQTWAERAQSFRANLGTKLRQGLVDQFAPIKEVSQEAYMLARMSKGSDGAVEAALMYGKPFLRDGVTDVDMKDGGFAKVLASLKGEHDRFFQWVAAQRAERLKAEGRENLLTDQDITALRSLNAGKMADGTVRMPLYAKALQELNAFNEASLKVALESGLIDQAAYDLMKDQPYVPFYRLMEDGDMRGPRFSSGLVNQQAWKKLKGGTQQISADLLQNTLLNWSHLYAAAARNRASLATMAEAEKLGIAYQVPADTKGAVKVMRDGVAEHWAVEDPYLLEAISALNYSPGGIVKALAPFKRLLTFGVTVNPTFKIRNLIRDSLSAIAQSDLSYNPAENVAKGWKATSKASQTYASMLASGGIIKFGTQENTDHLRGRIERLGGTMLDKQGWEKLTGQMRSLWETYEEFGDRTENVNRAALYERLRAKGLSHAEASFQARDLMDFSMSGKWEAIRFLTQTVPFLNARMQGLYKLGRAANQDPRRFAAMAGAVSAASLALLAAYGDDDDWKKREDWDRDNYWWFKIGETAFRIPKPFEVGAIGTLAERTAELMMSDEMTGKRFGQRISDMVFNTFAMDPTPQFIKPFIDVYANKDSFSGRAIEGMADERLRPKDRYNERTSEVARLLGSWGLPDPVRLAKGEYAGLSPKQVDFLLRGYFGWLAVVTTTATDTVTRPLLDRGERPAMRMRDTFFAGNFVEALPTGSSRYVSQMYEQARSIEQAWASHQAAIKSGDTELANSIMEEDGDKLKRRFAVNNAKRQISELGQQVKRIESSKLLSADAKRARLDEIEARRNAIAQRVATVMR